MQWRESVDPGMAYHTVKAAYLGQAAMWAVAGGARGGGGLGAVQSKPQWAGESAWLPPCMVLVINDNLYGLMFVLSYICRCVQLSCLISICWSQG